MKKHIIAISIAAALTTSTTFADNKAEGFKNLEDLGLARLLMALTIFLNYQETPKNGQFHK